MRKQPTVKGSLGMKVLIFAIFFLILSGALSIPFYFETMTLWYKVGAGKILLRGGQMAGMFALVLIFLQIILAVRGQYLEKLFGRAAMTRFHRVNGVIILAVAFSHVFLVLAPEGIANLPIGKKFWPEMIGGLLLSIITFTVISTYFQQRSRSQHAIWRPVHKSLGYLALLLLPTHVLFVSESFEQSQLRPILIMLVIMMFLWVIIEKIMMGFTK